MRKGLLASYMILLINEAMADTRTVIEQWGPEADISRCFTQSVEIGKSVDNFFFA